MNNKKTILTGIKNLKMQIKILMTEVHALENMVGEMENSLDSEDTNVTCTDEPVLPKSLDFQEMKDLLDKLAEELQINVGDTTPDGLFTLEATRCLGCCGLAPVMMIDEEVYAKRDNVGVVPEILQKYYEQRLPE